MASIERRRQRRGKTEHMRSIARPTGGRLAPSRPPAIRLSRSAPWPMLRYASAFTCTPTLSAERADDLADCLVKQWESQPCTFVESLNIQLPSVEGLVQRVSTEHLRVHHEIQTPMLDFPEYSCTINGVSLEFRPCLAICGSGECSKAWIRVCVKNYKHQKRTRQASVEALWDVYQVVGEKASEALLLWAEKGSAEWLKQHRSKLVRSSTTLEIYTVGSADSNLAAWLRKVGNPDTKEEARSIEVNDQLFRSYFEKASDFRPDLESELDSHPEAFWKPISVSFPVPKTTILEDASALYYVRVLGTALQAFGMGYHPHYAARLAYDSSLNMANSLGRHL